MLKRNYKENMKILKNIDHFMFDIHITNWLQLLVMVQQSQHVLPFKRLFQEICATTPGQIKYMDEYVYR